MRTVYVVISSFGEHEVGEHWSEADFDVLPDEHKKNFVRTSVVADQPEPAHETETE
jgi:hypothetical protein